MAIRLDPEGNEIAALTALVPSLTGCRVLEVGCGDGRLTRRYAERTASVLAIDPDESAIVALRSDLPRGPVDVRAIGFEDLVIPDQSLDVVLLSWSL